MKEWFAHEDAWLAPYALPSQASRGRRYTEPGHPFRTVFQRDRDRIIHSTAFRRLMGKTQVLVGQINDHHRTRLTHTLEVAQISRTIARRLRLNEDLTEAIALAHDLGHPPFGHAGETALNECTREVGGFDHNLYGLRRVDLLEDRYSDFPGLNLSWEVREAFIQHSKTRPMPEYVGLREAGRPPLEAQVVDAADSLAYDTHDVDDALGIGLINFEDLDGVELWRQAARPLAAQSPMLRGDALRTAVIRELISRQVVDLLEETESQLKKLRIETLQDIREQTKPIVCFTPSLQQFKKDLETFLRERVYKHYRVLRMAQQGRRLLQEMFAELVRAPELLPPRYLARWSEAPADLARRAAAAASDVRVREPRIERIVADYLAGMTDRFARQEYLRLFQSSADE